MTIWSEFKPRLNIEIDLSISDYFVSPFFALLLFNLADGRLLALFFHLIDVLLLLLALVVRVTEILVLLKGTILHVAESLPPLPFFLLALLVHYLRPGQHR